MTASQTWLITGASRGIGFNIVQQLLRSPNNIVFAACRNPTSANSLSALETVSETLGKLHVVQLDVADEASISRAMGNVKNILGDAGLDYLINNAGICYKNDTPSTLDLRNFTEMITANVAGPLLVTRIFMPLIERGNRKVILSISSSLGSISLDRGISHSGYSISKAALNMLTYKQAKERPDTIPFVVDPGWVKTDMGGDNAAVEPHETAAGILKVISSANESYAGRFFNYKGETLPW